MKLIHSKNADIYKIADCHRVAFPKSLSSQLHHFFTEKMLEYYLEDARGVLFHIELNNKVIGYCGGIKTKQSGLPGSSTSMAQYSFNSMIKALLLKPWLVFHEENLKRIPLIKKNILLKVGLKKKPKTPINQDTEFKPSWGLVVIGVNPEFQGKGVGTMLLQEFEKLAKEDKISKINLSVNQNNTKAIQSYKRNGWIVLAKNKDSLTMYKNI